MAKSADISAYNPVLFTVIQQVRDTGSYETSGTMQECMSLRFELYGFKRALVRAGHPDAMAAKQISWFIEELPNGSAKLTGLRKDRTKVVEMAKRGLTSQAQAVWPQPQDRPPGMDLPPIEPPVAEEKYVDPMQSALEKLGYFAHGDKDKPK